MVRAWSSIGDLSGLGVDALVGWWTHATDTWRMNLLIEGSPIIGFFLKMFPAWAQMPVITGYGLLLPLLPAALADASNPVWWTIAVLRAAGWTVLIPFLIGALLLLVQRRKWRELQVYLLVIVIGQRAGGGDARQFAAVGQPALPRRPAVRAGAPGGVGLGGEPEDTQPMAGTSGGDRNGRSAVGPVVVCRALLGAAANRPQPNADRAAGGDDRPAGAVHRAAITCAAGRGA